MVCNRVVGGPRSAQIPAKEMILYYHLDHLGTPIAMTDEDQDVVWSSEYYPFGGLYDETVVQANEFRFPGQFHDRETDLYYNWHRYYDSELGRYITADPIGLAGRDVNLYRFVRSAPLGYIDPTGLTDIYIETRRFYETGESTIGDLTITNSGDETSIDGYTLELPWRNNDTDISRIPLF